MANWHYYNEYGERVGPITGKHLKRLAKHGVITRGTVVETENGKTGLAKDVDGLVFAEPIPAQGSPLRPHNEVGVFPTDIEEVYDLEVPPSVPHFSSSTELGTEHSAVATPRVDKDPFSAFVSEVGISEEGKAAPSGSPGLEMFIELKGHMSSVRAAAFSPDGKKVVTACRDGIARIWDAESGKELQRLTGHAGWVNSAAFSPDGDKVVTGSGDCTARIWDAESGRELQRLTGHAGTVNFVAFSPDGKKVVTASVDTTARIWILE